MAYSIPSITDERLTQLAKRIRAVKEIEGGHRLYPLCDPRGESFSWAEKMGRKTRRLYALGKVRTLHGFGYYGLFKPSVAEVLAQIQAHSLLHMVDCFVVNGPKDSHDLNLEPEALNAGFHVAVTTLLSYIAPLSKAGMKRMCP